MSYKRSNLIRNIYLKNCENCGQEFFCEIEAGKEECWCFHKTPKSIDGNSCLCEWCLDNKLDL